MTLPSATARLKLFRQSFEDGEICEETGLTTEDLDVILAHFEQPGIPIHPTSLAEKGIPGLATREGQ
jgi:hypothetical protein